MNKSMKIVGLDCANCARELEEELSKIVGVNSAVVDFMGGKVLVDCSEEALKEVVYRCNHFEEARIEEEPSPSADERVMGERIKISGLCCANCGRELEEELNKIEGVEAVVDFMNMRIILNASTPEAREKALYAITHFEDVKIVGETRGRSAFKEHLKDIICLVVAALFFVLALMLDLTGIAWSGNLAAMICAYAFYALAYIAVGHPVFINTVKNLSKGRIFDENFLMVIASVGAIMLGIFTREGFFEGVAVMYLYQLGELLQSIAVGASRSSISDLMDLKSDKATLVVDGEQRVVSPEDLKTGDKIIIKVGEKVPVDCRICEGETTLDMKSLNGEPLPKSVSVGDEILSGSINVSKVVEAEAVREYADSAVAKILELVENSTAKKSKPEKFISKFAKYYTPAVCIAAVIVAFIVPTAIYFATYAQPWTELFVSWVYNALTFLVISCPCALVISVPLSYFSGIGRCAHFGILVKGSTCLDELALAKIAAFDKTGTITEGSFTVASYTDKNALALAAAAEKFSSHPIAVAFSDIQTEYVAENAEELAGRGIKCSVNGKTLLCGNAKLLKENGIAFTEKSSVSTLVYVALDGEYVGVIEVDDRLKEGVKEAVAALRASGVTYTEMLTGDLAERAEAISAQAGLDGCKAGLMPDGKLQRAEELKRRGKLMYVGDGINDAPVMTAADCSVSMGKMGSDAAIEASDVVLVSDNVSLLPKGRKIAKGTRRIVVQNIVGSLFVKFGLMLCDIILASLIACGVAVSPFPLIVSVVADVGVMLVAVLNAMRTSLIK